MSRIILADLKGRGGYVNKDTLAGGYGSRFQGHSFTTRFEKNVRRVLQNLPSIHIGYLASIFRNAGHDIIVTRRDDPIDGDLAIVLTSMVDYRHECEWANAVRKGRTKVGFVGTAATHMPELFEAAGDFVVSGAATSFLSDNDLSKYFWESIRPLDRFPSSYRRRFSNAQAILGLRALQKLDEFNERTRAHAKIYTSGLAECPSIETPHVIEDAEHVYYQYCIYVSDPKRAKRHAIRRGVDFEITHVDVCSSLPLFKELAANCPAAEKTTEALQLPVYSRLRLSDVERVLKVMLEIAADLAPLNKKTASVEEEQFLTSAANAMRVN